MLGKMSEVAASVLAPPVDPRPGIIKDVFHAADLDGDAALCPQEMLRFSRLIGFHGDDATWAAEYDALFKGNEDLLMTSGIGSGFIGLDLFTRLVNDESEHGCFCTNDELRKITAALEVTAKRTLIDTLYKTFLPGTGGDVTVLFRDILAMETDSGASFFRGGRAAFDSRFGHFDEERLRMFLYNRRVALSPAGQADLVDGGWTVLSRASLADASVLPQMISPPPGLAPPPTILQEHGNVDEAFLLPPLSQGLAVAGPASAVRPGGGDVDDTAPWRPSLSPAPPLPGAGAGGCGGAGEVGVADVGAAATSPTVASEPHEGAGHGASWDSENWMQGVSTSWSVGDTAEWSGDSGGGGGVGSEEKDTWWRAHDNSDWHGQAWREADRSGGGGGGDGGAWQDGSGYSGSDGQGWSGAGGAEWQSTDAGYEAGGAGWHSSGRGRGRGRRGARRDYR